MKDMKKTTHNLSAKNTSKQNKQEMNEDLKKWLKGEKKRQSDGKKTSAKKKKIKGKCEICGENPAATTCIKCGRTVCTSCYYHLVGLCEKCLSPDIAEKWKNKNPDWKEELGVDWVE